MTHYNGNIIPQQSTGLFACSVVGIHIVFVKYLQLFVNVLEIGRQCASNGFLYVTVTQILGHDFFVCILKFLYRNIVCLTGAIINVCIPDAIFGTSAGCI